MFSKRLLIFLKTALLFTKRTSQLFEILETAVKNVWRGISPPSSQSS